MEKLLRFFTGPQQISVNNKKLLFLNHLGVI